MALSISNVDPFCIRQELAESPRPMATRQRSQIVDFYANRSVLITGASGFIGKVLVEKLLRTCPSIKRIFVLIRPKWNKQPEERLKELLEVPLFDGVRAMNPSKKVVLVEGDVTQPNLGLSGNNLSKIIKEVSVIFHSAATVKFDEPLKQSVAINIAGTKNMVEVCRRIPHLAALVHVSTAYANCDRKEIEEHVYPMDMDPEKLMQMADWLDQDTLQELKRRLLGNRPNTYTYTKALAEWLLVRTARDLPVVVCRPSIVIASHREPFRGWIDNLNGPTGIILGAGKGLVRSMFAETSFLADLVPVDTVISLVVALGWFAHINKGHKQLSDSVDSFTESIVSGRSTSPCCSNSSAASISGDENYDSEQQDDKQGAERSLGCGSPAPDTDSCAASISSNRPSESKHKREVQQKTLGLQDEGYGSLRNSDYNSNASSDTASTSSSSSLTLRTHHLHNHLHHYPKHHHRRRQSRVSIKISTVPEQPGTTTFGQSTTVAKVAAGLSAPTTRMANGGEHEQTNHQFDSPEEQEAIIQRKLELFRQKAKSKLAHSQLSGQLADVPVFHCTSGGENPVTWGQIQVLLLTFLAIYPYDITYRYPNGSVTNRRYIHNFKRLTLHYIPGYILDLATKLVGGKPMIVKLYKKFDTATSVLEAFTTNQWHFKCDNRLFILKELMNEEDRRLFNFDLKNLKWDDFLRDYVLGVKKFLLKESMDNLGQARYNLQFTYYRNLSLQVLLLATSAYYIYCKLSYLLQA